MTGKQTPLPVFDLGRSYGNVRFGKILKKALKKSGN